MTPPSYISIMNVGMLCHIVLYAIIPIKLPEEVFKTAFQNIVGHQGLSSSSFLRIRRDRPWVKRRLSFAKAIGTYKQTVMLS